MDSQQKEEPAKKKMKENRQRVRYKHLMVRYTFKRIMVFFLHSLQKYGKLSTIRYMKNIYHGMMTRMQLK